MCTTMRCLNTSTPIRMTMDTTYMGMKTCLRGSTVIGIGMDPYTMRTRTYPMRTTCIRINAYSEPVVC